MRKPWFHAKKLGWGYGFPATWQGWVVLIIYAVFIVWDFHRLDAHSHSVSDTFRPFIVQLVIASIVLYFIARLTSGKPHHTEEGK